MKKITYISVCLILCMLFLTGCKNNDEQMVEGTGIYYLNTEGTGLVKEKYKIKGNSVEEQIAGILSEMQKNTDTIDYISPFPEDVEIEEWKYKSNLLNIYFNARYNQMDASSEILLRAALVQTLVQIEDVRYISFYANGEPIVDSKGNEIGYQNADDYVQNIGSTLHSYQKGELKLYFVNAETQKLKSENVSVRYNSNMSKEKLIVEQLIDGPDSAGLQAAFPENTKILGVSVRDGICYVNFDVDFLTTPVAVDPKLTIYSLVNSVVEGGNATKVQILVNGEANVTYQETIDFSQPFARDLDMIEEDE